MTEPPGVPDAAGICRAPLGVPDAAGICSARGMIPFLICSGPLNHSFRPRIGLNYSAKSFDLVKDYFQSKTLRGATTAQEPLLGARHTSLGGTGRGAGGREFLHFLNWGSDARVDTSRLCPSGQWERV